MGGSNRIAVEFMSGANKRFQSEDLQIRSMGLEGLVLVLKSLVLASEFNSVATNGSMPLCNGATRNQVDDSEEKDIKEPSETTFPQLSTTPQSLNSPQSDEASPIPRDSTGASLAGGDGSNPNIVGVFDKKLKTQEEIDNGIVKFNLSPMKGIKYLSALGHLLLEPKEVAKFLHDHGEKLDKTMVGDLLGREKDYESGFCYKVLHEYVQALDFSSMTFDAAMRYFLGGFRLPGEAQKIDRIMEKFAERYYIQHKDEFASADMAFILAFSTIMLQTNLHNPAIRDDKRMTKDQFIKQNKGISSDGELSDELLSDIYDRIAAQPISITQDVGNKKGKKEEQNNSFVVFQSISDRKKKDAFSHERKEMVRAGEAMIKQMKKRANVFLKNVTLKDEVFSYIKAMYEIVWPPMLAVLSQILETYDDPILMKQCLQGFQLGILLACRVEFPVARNTFVNALVKFTTLDSVREMKPKNLMCTKLMLAIALSEGEYLEESWIQILQNISHLARLLLFATGLHTDDVFFSDSASASSEHGRSQSYYTRRANNIKYSGDSRSAGSGGSGGSSMLNVDPFTKLFMGPSKAETIRLVQETNSELLGKDIDSSLIDKIFTSSTNLSGNSILHFVSSLCDVSMAEISITSSMNSMRSRDNSGYEASSPRVFSLQKLVEVADCNMNLRSRLDWAKIWSLLANHFSIVGVNENQNLAMFAID
jgi:brefeldin A-inhibited guanine nucleotide-exchange protein